MCWCLKVFYRIIGNLANRIFRNVADTTYGMGRLCFCLRNSGSNVQNVACEEQKSKVEEPFYRNVDRENAEELLKGKQNGTFIIRPPPPLNDRATSIGILSVIQDNKIFHLVIRVRRDDSLIALGREKLNEKSFKDLNGLINYYISNYLILYSDGIKSYTLLLPYS